MKCNHCDKTIPEGSSFCPYCGKRIEVIPESWKCPQCNLDVPAGTRLCPNCGSPIAASKSTTCSNYGAEMEEKERLGSNRREYTHDANCYQINCDKNDKQDTNNKLVSKAGELIQQSKKYVSEKVHPQFDETIEELKKVDWEQKKNESVKTMKEFLSNADKLRKATIGVAIIAVLWFFIFNHGFSASWTWWLFAVAFIIAAFYKIETKSESEALTKARWSFGLAIVLGLVFVLHSPSGSSSLGDLDDDVGIEANNDQDLEILVEMSKIRGEIRSILPQVEVLYNAHQQHMARGFTYGSTPAWGRWQDCNRRIDNLWDDYIRLARKLSGNNDEVIEEARESKRKMDKAFMDMFGPHY